MNDFVVKLSSHTFEVKLDCSRTGGHQSVSIWPKVASSIFNTSFELWHASLLSATESGFAQNFLIPFDEKNWI